MAIRLIASDLDGAFLNNQGGYDHRRFTQLYQQLQRRGIQLVMTSRRSATMMATQFVDYPNLWLVGGNGAELMQPTTAILASTFPRPAVVKILTILAAYSEVQLAVCGSQVVYLSQQATPSFVARVQHDYPNVRLVRMLRQVCDAVVKIEVACDPQVTEQLVYELTPKLAGLAMPVINAAGQLDLLQPGRDKGKAVHRLGQRLGIGAHEMLAFGAGLNAQTLLHQVHTGVAMANAPISLQSQADALTATNDQNGVCTYLERHLLPSLQKSTVFSEN
ncbi:HAD hydrolase family protein [Lactiplantibacillus mudanjiangensis]|uniref:HAD family hydrolase [Lactobacillus sp.] n=1 Tax=Lactiplantibacillus mudanjiangensis TaxID=1296538 RepID=A0A660EAX8_9LACO|nr:HAD family hydrolase [Lactiplantibacillus mudanjiangensis]VDG20116.1 HAD family hydrolase [Lactobacillus sp.] [Lactiplantibacillus mudanjiangensis]VDG23813.1 HAD family hydrolase [Lactobacillus sp.] [Lactiplantibacillus mudanjiangensis]VDG30367.1 HAD family hydrolase [Lactobacillus sp.] [Lactiplantibacillus mudanjiangensis]VDG33511.1 HAD family hydrolase [Lactobacillus sp.] [Lactiplantibacillus mudanjiangensis]